MPTETGQLRPQEATRPDALTAERGDSNPFQRARSDAPPKPAARRAGLAVDWYERADRSSRRDGEAPLSSVLGRIAGGEYKAGVKAVRAAETKAERRRLKTERLPLVTFGAVGAGHRRQGDGAAIPTGLVILDFDGYPTPKAAKAARDAAVGNAGCIAAFLTPSGVGVRTIHNVPILRERPADARTQAVQHAVYAAVEAAMLPFMPDGSKPDGECKDVLTRLSYLSWDKNLRLQPGAEPFDASDALNAAAGAGAVGAGSWSGGSAAESGVDVVGLKACRTAKTLFQHCFKADEGVRHATLRKTAWIVARKWGADSDEAHQLARETRERWPDKDPREVERLFKNLPRLLAEQDAKAKREKTAHAITAAKVAAREEGGERVVLGPSGVSFDGFLKGMESLGVEARYNDLSASQELLMPHMDDWKVPEAGEDARLFAMFTDRVTAVTKDGPRPWKPAAAEWRKYMLAYADLEHVNPFADWVEEQEIDPGGPGLDELFIELLGAEDTPLVREAGRLTMTAAARRALVEPGCKFDYVPVLIGEQGSAKSTAPQFLFPQELRGACVTDGLELFGDDNRFYYSMAGRVFCICDELVGSTKADVERVKARITRSVDQYRTLYYDKQTPRPRRGVFLATANDGGAGVLPPDPTGMRRWLPVHVPPPPEGADAHKPLKDALEIARAWRGHWWALALEAARRGDPLVLDPELIPAQRDACRQTAYNHYSLFTESVADWAGEKFRPGDTMQVRRDLYVEGLDGRRAPRFPNTPPDNRLRSALEAAGFTYRRNPARYKRGATAGVWTWREGEAGELPDNVVEIRCADCAALSTVGAGERCPKCPEAES